MPANPMMPTQIEPWSTLAKKGLMGTPNASAIGAELGDAVRAGLRDAVQRIADTGATFEVEPGWIGRAVGEARHPLDTAQVVDHLTKRPLPFKRPLLVSLSGRDPMPVKDLVDLRALDVACSVTAAATTSPVGRALQHIGAQGWTFSSYDHFNNVPEAPGPFAAAVALSRNDFVMASPPAGGADPVQVNALEDLVMLDYFACGGPSEGLANRPLAEGLKALEDKGYRFTSRDYPAGDKDAFTSFRSWGHHLLAGREGGVKIPFEEAELQDLPRLEQRIATCTDLYERYGKPVLEPLATGERANTTRDFDRNRWMLSVTDHSLCPRLSVETRAELLGVLMASPNTAVDDLRALAARISDPTRLREEAEWLARLRETVSNPDKVSDTLVARLRDHLFEESGSREQHAEARSNLLRLSAAIGNLEATVKAFDLVRMPTGPESPTQRVALIGWLAGQSPERRTEAPRDFETILLHQLPGDRLESAVTRFGMVRSALAVKGQTDRTREIYTRLQEGVRAAGGDGRAADDCLRRFGEGIALSADIDHALENALHPRSEQPTGTVQVEQDGTLVVGGVRVPVQPTAEAPPPASA